MQNNWVNFSKAAFLPYARFFRSPKGGGHGPSGPMVNTPMYAFDIENSVQRFLPGDSPLALHNAL